MAKILNSETYKPLLILNVEVPRSCGHQGISAKRIRAQRAEIQRFLEDSLPLLSRSTERGRRRRLPQSIREMMALGPGAVYFFAPSQWLCQEAPILSKCSSVHPSSDRKDML